MRTRGRRHVPIVLLALFVASLWPEAVASAAPSPSDPADDVWLSPAELAALPVEGEAWNHLRRTADERLRSKDADLAERNDHNTITLAAALVGQRLGDDGYRQRAVDALRDVLRTPPSRDDVLAAARRLVTYVVTADVLDLHRTDPTLDAEFRDWLMRMQRLRFTGGGGGGTIAEVHERRANNFGTSAGASRIAAAAYLDDRAELERAAEVFRGWLGDRAAYTGFQFGELGWQADPATPVGINPEGATRDGHDIDGVLPDDQRRAGPFRWPPQRENYVWGALQGAVLQAQLLYRQGYPAWTWEDEALRRALVWLHDEADFPAEGDDRWVPWLVNYAYGTDFPVETGGTGKSLAFTEWTHAPPDPDADRVDELLRLPPTGAAPAPGLTPPHAGDRVDGHPIHLRTLAGGGSRTRTAAVELPSGTRASTHVLAVSTKPFALIRAVRSPGGSWRRVVGRCGARGQTGVELWIGAGPLAEGQLAVTLDRAVHNVVVSLSSFSGAHPTDPVAATAVANALGVDGRCSGGRDTDRPVLALPSTGAGTTVAITALRARRHESDAPAVELIELHQGSGGRAAGLAVTVAPATASRSTEVSGRTSRPVDWAMVAVTLRPATAPRVPTTGAARGAVGELAAVLIALGGLSVAGRRTRSRRRPAATDG